MKVLSFTGSREVGHALYLAAGPRRVLLELGGNAGAIVDEDADLDHAAARLAIGAFAYAGQVCISVQRIFVLEAVYEPFLERLVAAARAMPVGERLDPEALCGPMIDRSNADRIESWIDEALAAGARAPLRGERRGNAIEPTVLTKVNPSARVSREEAFGPVVTVAPVASLDAAIAAVNDSDYGLQAAIFSRSVASVMRAFAGLDVGGVIHDEASTFRVDHMPYGGVKGSGLGREGIRYAVDEMTEIRHLVLTS